MFGSEHTPLAERFKHFTWAWFTAPMSTGGLALLLSATPHQFDGLRTIGKVLFIFDLILFIGIVAGITARFILLPAALKSSLTYPSEALFFPTAWLALSNIINCAHAYGTATCGPWLQIALRVLFWIYVPCTFLVAVGQYWLLFDAPARRLTVQSMTPTWILPIYPLMLAGTIASVIAGGQPDTSRVAILVAGVTCQGLGWMVALLMYAVYISRLMAYGLPLSNLRPGMFIAVGPPSFTGLALIGMSKNLPAGYSYFATHPLSIDILQELALWTAIFLWMLSFFWFCIALLSVVAGLRRLKFNLVFWASVFPNVGFTIATIQIGRGLNSEAILWVASAMTIVLVIVWLVLAGLHIKAVVTKHILMPGMDEDKDQSDGEPERIGPGAGRIKRHG